MKTMMRMRKVVWTVAAAGVMLALQAPAVGQQDKAADVLAATRKAIGGKKLDGMKSFSVQAKVQRNMGNMQIATESEFLLDMPDKYLRSDTMTGGPMNVSTAMGFSGDTPVTRVNAPGMAGNMVVRMAGPGGPMAGPNEKLTPEQQEQMAAAALRASRQDITRLMLGWFGMSHPTVPVEYRYAGEAESPDGRAHVIDVTGPDNFAARLFIDQETNLPLMLTYKAPQLRIQGMRGAPGAGGGIQVQRQGGQMTEEEREKLREEFEKMRNQPPEMVEYSLFFADWREADGIKFPHAIQRSVGGTTDEEWTLSRPRVNPKIDQKKFTTQ
jgi:hypothetical protein